MTAASPDANSCDVLRQRDNVYVTAAIALAVDMELIGLAAVEAAGHKHSPAKLKLRPARLGLLITDRSRHSLDAAPHHIFFHSRTPCDLNVSRSSVIFSAAGEQFSLTHRAAAVPAASPVIMH